jgi:hypothetical protein
MTKDQIAELLRRVRAWPEDRQLELAQVAFEIEAEFAGTEYRATAEELAAIDEGLTGKPARAAEVETAFALFQRA